MTSTRDRNAAKFDAYATEYEGMHASSVAITGEGTEYFADYKVRCLQRAGVKADDTILDFGCGIGNVTRRLVREFPNVCGYEPSTASSQVARGRAVGATIESDLALIPDGQFSVALLSGVLHHIPPAERPEALRQVFTKLKPGGRVFVFEHNPLNPFTRRAVTLCPFDDDAILLWPGEAKCLLRDTGFFHVLLDYIVFFPRWLAVFRPCESLLRWLPLGGQTLLIGTKPG